MRRVGDDPLWIGTARDARDIRSVLDAGVEAIVDLAMEEVPVRSTRELMYFRLPLVDGEGNSPLLLRLAVRTVALLAQDWVPTLVSCSAGMSRSPAVVAVALNWISVETPDEVLSGLSQQGPTDVSPALWRDLLAVKR